MKNIARSLLTLQLLLLLSLTSLPSLAHATRAAAETPATAVLVPTTTPAPEDTQPAVSPASDNSGYRSDLPSTGSPALGFLLFALLFTVTGYFALIKRK